MTRMSYDEKEFEAAAERLALLLNTEEGLELLRSTGHFGLDAGWTEGGCLILALALMKVLPKEEKPEIWVRCCGPYDVADHFAIYLPLRKCFLDGDGCHSLKVMLTLETQYFLWFCKMKKWNPNVIIPKGILAPKLLVDRTVQFLRNYWYPGLIPNAVVFQHAYDLDGIDESLVMYTWSPNGNLFYRFFGTIPVDKQNIPLILLLAVKRNPNLI